MAGRRCAGGRPRAGASIAAGRRLSSPGSLLALAAVVVLGCAAPEGGAASADPAAPAAAAPVAVRALDPPAAEGAFAPDLTPSAGALLATWLERLDAAGGTPRHRVRLARLVDDAWSEPVTVAEGDDFFANWADFPAVAEAAGGALYVHWLAKTGDDTYAYAPHLARSEDGGRSWTALGTLNDDTTPTEHGFVSWVPEGDGVRAFWLDGREMVSGGAMGLRTALVGAAGVGVSEVLDDRTCECCSTDAALAPGGAVVVYRDRTAAEVRDVQLVRRAGGAWAAPARVAADAWKIPGCPVNGPEIAVEDERAAVAWFTGAGDDPTVQVAFSTDGAASFGAPVELDLGSPLGRVDVVLDGGDALVAWLRQAEGGGEIRVRRVAPDGRLGEALLVAKTAAARASGFPRLARVDGRSIAAWVEISADSPSRVRVAEISVPAID